LTVTARKSERLMNLVICLLVARTYVPKARIREVVEGYRDQSEDAFEKMFERDKEALKDLGLPIELGYNDKAFEDEPGYRIKRSDFELPPVMLEADEAAVVGLAARVWQHARLAEATSSALVKLRAAGVEVDAQALAVIEPQVGADEPSFGPMWDAVVNRKPVAFEHRRGGWREGDGETMTRHLEPWGIVSSRGHWYVVGYDRDRAAERMFRLSRVVGDVVTVGRAGSYTVPDSTDIRQLASQLATPDPTGKAVLRLREGAAYWLRRRALSVRPDGVGWDLADVPYTSTEALAEEVVPLGHDAVVIEPESVRTAVVHRLEALVGRAQ
jgi:proteasome accessory factor B